MSKAPVSIKGAGRSRRQGSARAARPVPRRPGAIRRIGGVVRRHPLASVVTAVAAGALTAWVVQNREQLRRAFEHRRPIRLPDFGALLEQLKPELQPVARRIGVAAVQASMDLGGGAHRKFGFGWKRRGDGAEENWPTDEVEIGSTRADGGRSAWQLTWKVLPEDVPDPPPRYPGDSPLGETSMHLETKHADGRKTGMSFTWRKRPVARRLPGKGS